MRINMGRGKIGEFLQRFTSAFYEVLVRNAKGLLGLLILVAFALVAIFAPLIAPYDPYARVGAPFEPPSPRHPLGTNDIGQDVLSEVIYGTRISFYVGLTAPTIATLIGMLLGIIAGYMGGKVDEVVSGVIDIMLAIPSLPLIIILAAYLGQSLNNIVLILAITGWVGVARVVRSQVLSLKERLYVEAARAVGASDSRIMMYHILPNIMPLMVAYVILGATSAILTEAGLSFLGLGDPTAKSWGQILHHAQVKHALQLGLWLWAFVPGLMIALMGMGFTLLGMSLEEYLNPRLKSYAAA